MTEAVFPVLGVAFVILFVLPLSALIAKACLVFLERGEGPLHGLNTKYILLTCSSLVPLAWFLSAGLHQIEAGQSTLACIFDHDTTAHCFEPGFFSLSLGSFVVACLAAAAKHVRGERPAATFQTGPVFERVSGLLSTRPALGLLRGNVLVTTQPGFALGTHGWLKPRILIGAEFADQLSDEMLASALGHEAEHVRSLDPLRYLLLRLALLVNPVGRWLLEPHAKRWHAAREAHCDREAVVRGSLPLPLADAIVRASRPGVREVVAIGARDVAVVRLRISMLIAFSERRPARCCHRGASAIPAAVMVLFLALALPHQTGTAALDAVHTGAEHALFLLLR